MKIIAKNQTWKYLFWFGPFLITAGLTIGLVTQQWGIIPFIFIISGIVIIGLWLGWQSHRSNWWGQRSTQAGTNALVATLAVLVILGLTNFLASRYHLRTDLTEAQLFTIAPQSKELVRSLKTPVKIWVFDVTDNPVDRELLENYRRQNPKFQYEYVDPQARPFLAQRFGVNNYGEVYLESGNTRQIVQVVNEGDRLSENRLTNRLQQISNGSIAKVYALQGHGEHQLEAGQQGLSQAVQALTDKNYTVTPLNLVQTASIPEDAAVVVVAGPERALFDTEVPALQDYLNRGGNLLLMIDPNTQTKLDSLLSEWGVKLDNRLALNSSKNVETLGPGFSIVTEYGKHPITKDFGNGISVYKFARPIEITPVPGIEATPLLITQPYPETWAESDQKSENFQFDEGSDLKGPLTLGVALTRKAGTKINTPTSSSTPPPSPSPTPSTTETTKESRLVVLGNSDFATDGSFDKYLNGDVFLNSVTWLSQQDQQILSIRPKEPKNRRLNFTQQQAILLTSSSLLFLPMLGFATAAILWWLRR
jgi:ABC-type uncharacterized transport system involved in gliding motility auxiliary subunit